MGHFGSGMQDALGLLTAHWRDMAERCRRDNRPYFTDFVPAEDFVIAEKVAAASGVQCLAWGGVTAAARVLLCFLPENFPMETSDFPITCLTFTYRSVKPLSHRDFLGSMLSCNLERDTIGDILIAETTAQAFVCRRVAAVLEQELMQVGRVGVHVDSSQPVFLSPQDALCPVTGTVASLRADAIVAFATRLSREKAAQLIRQGRMTCRHTTIETPSAQMQIGDVFSIRGFGKFRIDAVDGVTRKGRYHITIQKYQ